MKGVPDHGAGAHPAPTAQAKGGTEVWFEAHGWVRRSTAVPGSTALRHDRSAEVSGLGQSPEGFLPRVSSARPYPSPTRRVSDKRSEDTTGIVNREITASRGISPDITKECAPPGTKKAPTAFPYIYSRVKRLSMPSGTGPEDRKTKSCYDGHRA